VLAVASAEKPGDVMQRLARARWRWSPAGNHRRKMPCRKCCLALAGLVRVLRIFAEEDRAAPRPQDDCVLAGSRARAESSHFSMLYVVNSGGEEGAILPRPGRQ